MTPEPTDATREAFEAWDGAPPDANADGWHWLTEESPWSKPEPAFWCANPGVWRGKGKASDAARLGVRYLAPCPFPEAARATLAERDAEIARLTKAIKGALENMQDAHYGDCERILEAALSAASREGG